MKTRKTLLILLPLLWLLVGCESQPPPSPITTPTLIQPTDTLEPTTAPPTPNPIPTEGIPAWLPVPPENPTIIQLTDNPDWDDEQPVWSPDGSQILYRSNRDCVKRYGDSDADWGSKSRCEWDLYLMDVDGRNETRLTDVQFRDGQSDAWLRWSPDGERIAFTYSNFFDLPFERVLSFSLDKAKQAPLGLEDMEVLVDKGEDYLVGSFEWSPDGKKYAYDYVRAWEYPPEQWDIIILDEESGEEVFRKTTTGEKLCKFGAWSPDGEIILVSCFHYSVDWEYHIDWVDLKTGNQRLLIENAHHPVWSPDGKWILYFFDKQAGGSRNELLHLESGEVVHFPYRNIIWDIWSWSPDGKWLAITQSPEPEHPYDHRINISLLDMSWLEMEWEQ